MADFTLSAESSIENIPDDRLLLLSDMLEDNDHITQNSQSSAFHKGCTDVNATRLISPIVDQEGAVFIRNQSESNQNNTIFSSPWVSPSSMNESTKNRVNNDLVVSEKLNNSAVLSPTTSICELENIGELENVDELNYADANVCLKVSAKAFSPSWELSAASFTNDEKRYQIW